MKIKRFAVIISLILILFTTAVLANNITFTVNQQDYYFKTGENAFLPLEVENNHEKQINGMLSYTITQEINTGNVHQSNTNTQSQSFIVPNENNTINLGFGTSNAPTTLHISFNFNYNEDQEDMSVKLDGINIYFVHDDSQKQNQENKQQSTSQNQNEEQQQQDESITEQIQKKLDEMMNNEEDEQKQQQQQKQDSSQKMQNNQMAQDSSALKKQMQQEIQKKEELKKEFEKNLEENEEFQKQEQELKDQEYKPENSESNPTSNNTGSFEKNYKKENGETAQLKGSMENGEIQDLQKETSEDQKNMIEQMHNSTKFQKLDEQLKKEGFTPTENKFDQQKNSATATAQYQNDKNQTANITAQFENKTLKKIKLQKEDNKKSFWWILYLVIIGIISYLFYKKNKKENIPNESVKEKKPFNYLKESKKMLELAQELFSKKEYKDAYQRAGQGLRLFLSYENGLKKELTNDEILKHLLQKKINKKTHKEIKECFDLCSLVEFAKYTANKKDFDKIIRLANNVIEKNN